MKISFLQHPQDLPVNQKMPPCHHPPISPFHLWMYLSLFVSKLCLFLILRSCSSVNVLQILYGFSLITRGNPLYLLLCKLDSSYVSWKEDKSDDTLMTWAGKTAEEHYRDHIQPRDSVNTKRIFFLDVGRSPAASPDSIQFHMVSHCSAIKLQI